MSERKRVAEEVRERAQIGTFVLIDNSELLFLMHSVNRLLATYWNPATCTSCGGAPNEGPSEATVQLLLTIGSVAFLWKRQAWIPRRLREARAAHPVDPTLSNYRLRPMIRRSALEHP